jgi:hypothetical protein
MSQFTEEIPGQIAAIINRLGDGRYTRMSIYPLPADAAYDETVNPTEWIQTTGIAPDRLTVEIKQADATGVHRLYTIGRPAGAGESAPTEPIENGDNTYLVRPAEVLTATDAIALFQHYYDTHAVPVGWDLREQPEFADSAVAEQPGTKAAADDTKPSVGRAPVAESSATQAETHVPAKRKPTGTTDR